MKGSVAPRADDPGFCEKAGQEIHGEQPIKQSVSMPSPSLPVSEFLPWLPCLVDWKEEAK